MKKWTTMQKVNIPVIKMAMIRKGYNPFTLSKQIKACDNTIYRMIRTSEASPKTIKMIADVLELTVEEIIFISNEM